MGDPLGGTGGSSSVPLPAGADKPAAAPAGPQIRQGDADTIREASQKLSKDRIEELEGKLGSKAATQMKKDKPNILKDILVGKKGRQQNAQKLAAKTGTYAGDVAKAITPGSTSESAIGTFRGEIQPKSGYLNALENAAIYSRRTLQTNPRDRIQVIYEVIYDKAYKAGGSGAQVGR